VRGIALAEAGAAKGKKPLKKTQRFPIRLITDRGEAIAEAKPGP